MDGKSEPNCVVFCTMKDMDDGGRDLDWEDVNDAEAVLSCACCKKDERLLYQELKQCGRCRKTLYCSR